MNANGISVFYGATAVETAIAEVRPPVGSNVIVAQFKITRPLKVLDLTQTTQVEAKGSIFDSEWLRRLERAAFLGSLTWRMARPVMPDDEAFEYLPTQAVADFLATVNDPLLDGILFPSVQSHAGLNVVLFQKSARVAELVLKPGTKVEAYTETGSEEGWETRYDVVEKIPSAKPDKADELGLSFELYDPRADQRSPALAIDLPSMAVHKISAVAFVTTRFAVTRQQFSEDSPGF